MTIQKILLKHEPKKENLLRAIKEINKNFTWVSPEAIEKIAKHFSMPKSAVYSKASFYDEINVQEPPFVLVQVCSSANCQTKNADKIIKELENFFGNKFGDSFNKKIKFEKISCMARCLNGPVMKINETVYTQMDPPKAIQIISEYLGAEN
ncbi:MAG: NAD(P)H-dependent oxidoreductase subunit E [Candidatus Moraniibacteriota bacterium]